MQNNIIRPFLVFWVLVGLAGYGCTLAQVKVEVMSERTTLENQVLGTYNALDNQMLMAASVRGVDSSGRISPAPQRSQEQKDVLAAMQLLAFHADDLNRFKQLGWVGENTEGLVSLFARDLKKIPEEMAEFAGRVSQEEFEATIAQINEARTIVMERVVVVNENLNDQDMPKVRQVFAKMNRDNARPGEKIQLPDGKWVPKSPATGS